MLWIGERFGPIERACARSVLAQGHSLTLWTYGPVDGIPEGVTRRDGAEIVSPHAIVRHRNGSVSLFSNRFRFELLRLGAGIWLDADAYLLKPLPVERPCLMGEQAPGDIATGILRLPADCPVITDILELFEEKTVPHWICRRARLAATVRLWLSGRTGIESMPWGSLGPNALTACARSRGIAHLALRAPVFYPVHWTQAEWVANSAITLEDVLCEETVAIHLWNERIKAFKNEPAPAGSFLERLQAEGR